MIFLIGFLKKVWGLTIVEFVQTIISLLVIVIMVACGFFFARMQWITKETAPLLPMLVNRLALPTYMIWNFLNNFTKEDFYSLAGGLAVPYISMLISFIIGNFVVRFAGIERDREGVFQAGFFSSSAIFIGVPVCLALFGDKSIPYVLIYFLANASMFWTLGNYSINKSCSSDPSPILSWNTVRLVFSPPLISFILAVIFVLLGVTLPTFLMSSFKYLGSMVTPLSMLFIGYTLSTVKMSELKFGKDINLLLCGRFLVSPLLVILVARFIEIPYVMQQVFVVLSALPVMAQVPILASIYGADAKYAAVIVSLTTLLCLFVIPVYMYFF